MTDNLAVDLYEGDGNYNLEALGAAGLPWALVMLKVSQGNYYTSGAWLKNMWTRAGTCWGDRFGKTGFRVPYHYLDCAIDGGLQGNYFLEQLASNGGFLTGVPFLVMDLERGGQRRPFSKDQIVTCAKAFVDYVHQTTGKIVVCYGGEYLRDNKITIEEVDCAFSWVADYDAVLAPSVYQSVGSSAMHTIWQYCGVESANNVDVHLKGYPWTTPAGPADISALILNGGGDAALSMLASWCSP